MARCPFGPHRLTLASDLSCNQCGQNLSVYAAVRDLPLRLFNLARQHLEEERPELTETCLDMALELCADLPQAYWLRAATAARQNDPKRASELLHQAREAGAEVDLDWLAPESRETFPD